VVKREKIDINNGQLSSNRLKVSSKPIYKKAPVKSKAKEKEQRKIVSIQLSILENSLLFYLIQLLLRW